MSVDFNVESHLSILLEAARARRAVAIFYQKPDESPVTGRMVEPYCILYADKDDSRYLLGWQIAPDTDDGTRWRTFRLDRAESVQMLEVHFEPRAPVIMEDGHLERLYSHAGEALEIYARAVKELGPNPDETCTRCARRIRDGEMACVLDDRIVCRNCHDQARPVCPNCNSTLPRAPKSSKWKCSICGRIVFVRLAQTYFDSIYLTESQLQEMEPFGSRATREYRKIREELIPNGEHNVKPDQVKHLADAMILRRIEEQNKRRPASYAQICFAIEAGVDLSDLTSEAIRHVLTAYQELKWEVINTWRELTNGEEPLPQEVGKFVCEIIKDSEFQRRANRRDDWNDFRLSAKARSYFRRSLREHLLL